MTMQSTAPDITSQAREEAFTYEFDCTEILVDAQTPTVVSIGLFHNRRPVTLPDSFIVSGTSIYQRVADGILVPGSLYELRLLCAPTSSTNKYLGVLQIECSE